MRLKLTPETLSLDYFGKARIAIVFSILMVIASLGAFFTQGLNFGIDFKGGTTIRTEASVPADVAAWRDTLSPLNLGDITISEVFDPSFEEDQHVAMVRIEAQDETASVKPETLDAMRDALDAVAPGVKFVSVESVGPKVSGELITGAVKSVLIAISVVLFYIWVRFEWQYAVGAVTALVHDVVLTIGIFSALQIRFDLAIIAALLTIVGYSLNDTVVVFDRHRELLKGDKESPLKTVLNRSINDTMSRTLMTSMTTLLALVALLIWGGDVIRGFVFAMTWGVVVGTYSSVFVASALLPILGVERDPEARADAFRHEFMDIDA